MSLQKAATILNVLNQNLAAMAASVERPPDTATTTEFMQIILSKQGWPAEELAAVQPTLQYLVDAIKAP